MTTNINNIVTITENVYQAGWDDEEAGAFTGWVEVSSRTITTDETNAEDYVAGLPCAEEISVAAGSNHYSRWQDEILIRRYVGS